MSYDWSTRHPSVQEKCRWLEPNPNLPAGTPATVAVMFRDMRDRLLEALEDGPQLSLGLQHLIDGKDCLVRQSIADSER
jgi:hypothetical protein